MTPRRPTPIKSDLATSPAAVIAPTTNAGNTGNAGDAVTTGSAGTSGKSATYKLTARANVTFIGRCRAAYLHARLTQNNAPESFEAWIITALEEKLAQAEHAHGQPFTPVSSLTRGRRMGE